MENAAQGTRVGIQLYSLRDLSADLPDIIGRVGKQGYAGVEFADRVRDADVDAVRAAMTEAAVEPVAAHVSLSQLETRAAPLLDRYAALDCPRLVIPHVSSKHLLTRDRVDALADRLVALADDLADHGFDLLVHNTRAMHFPLLDRYRLANVVGSGVLPQGGWYTAPWAFDRLTPSGWRGQTAFERLVERTGPELTFEVDIKEVATAGRDLSAVLDTAGDRVQAVHLSNATRTRRFPPAYRGSGLADGIVDIETSLRTALDRSVEWVIVESEDATEPLSTTTDVAHRLLADLGADFGTRDPPSAETG